MICPPFSNNFVFTTRNVSAVTRFVLFYFFCFGGYFAESLFSSSSSLYGTRSSRLFLERHQPVPTLESIPSSFQCLIEKEGKEEKKRKWKKKKKQKEQ